MTDTGPGGKSNSSKRKWFKLYGDAPTPPRVAKRAVPARQPGKEDYRREIAGVYAAYDALFGSCREGKAQDADYVALLKAAEGSPAAKRLVARLLPRFAKYFPSHARATSDVLTYLSRLSINDAPAVAAETRTDALAGLPAVVTAAKAATDHQAVIKLVDYAFKQLQSLPAACLPPHILPNGTANGEPQPSTPISSKSSLSSKATAPFWSLLEAAFTHFPRVVLAACIHALKRPDDHPQLFAVASQFVLERLLAPRRSVSAEEASELAAESITAVTADEATAAGSSGASGEVDDAIQQQKRRADGTRAQSDGTLGQKQQPRSPLEADLGPSLFKQVMVAEEREQRWFRQHVQQFLQELPPTTGVGACVVLQQLVKQLPPTPQRPKLQGAASGKQGRSGASGDAAQEDGTARRLSLSNGSQHTQQHPSLTPVKRRGFSDGPSGLAAHVQPPSAVNAATHSANAAAAVLSPLHPPGFGLPVLPSSGASQQPPGSPTGTPAAWNPRLGRSFDEGPPSTSYPVREGRLGRRSWQPGSGETGREPPAPMEVDEPPAAERAPGGAGKPPPAHPPPGENVCLAAACLWLHGLPAYLDEGDVSRECGRHGRVVGAVLPPPVPGQPSVAYINFASVRDAMRCYEAMCEAAPWRGCRPLDIRFCSFEAYSPTALQPPQQQPCTHVWVVGVANIGDEGEVMQCCKEGGVPAPEHLLRVGGPRPGLLLSFATESAAALAVQAIRGSNLRLSGFLPGPPGAALDSGFGALGPSGLQPGEPANGPLLGEACSFGIPRGLSLEGSGALQGLPSGTAAAAPLGLGSAPVLENKPRLPPPEYMSRTLWVGQIPPTMRDDELLRAFAACGELMGHKFMRHTNCAFIDFATQVGATEARKKLDGARVGPALLRVEYKNEKHWWAGQGARMPLAGATAAGPAGSGGREAQPPLRSDSGAGRGRDGHHPPFRDHPPGPMPPLQQGQQAQQQHLSQPPEGAPQMGPPGVLQPLAFTRGGPVALPAAASNAGGGGGSGTSLPALPHGWPPRGVSGALPAATPPPHLNQQQPLSLQQHLPPREGLPATTAAQDGGQRGIRRLESAMSLGLQPTGSGGLPPAVFVPGGTHTGPGMAGGQHPLPSGQPQQQPSWQGRLAKSKVPVCGVICIDSPVAAASGGSWAHAEPQHWPPVLDVGMRADLQYVCSTVYPQVPVGERAVRRIVPLADPAQQRAFSEFVQYLQGKSRAGVVKLPSLQPVGARVMYLIPPSEQARSALGVPFGDPPECMMALVVPASAK